MDEMRKLLSNSVFDISENGQTFTIKNLYQTKSIIVKSKNVKRNSRQRRSNTNFGKFIYLVFTQKS